MTAYFCQASLHVADRLRIRNDGKVNHSNIVAVNQCGPARA
jgi:hypothetical protein